jgi:CheY-like chemotaxis protein
MKLPGLEIFDATYGLEVIAQYKLHKPDVILIDDRIPNLMPFRHRRS